MKRVEKHDEEINGESGFKKVRFFNGSDVNDCILETPLSVEERIFAENAVEECAEIERNSGILGNEVSGKRNSGFLGNEFSGDLGNLNLVGVKIPNRDFDLNLCEILGNEEQQKDLGFDLNYPIAEELAQQGVLMNDNGVEIIDIVSDDSDDVAEVGSSIFNYKAKGKQVEIPMALDRMEDLSLGLGLSKMYYFFGESSSSVTAGDMKYPSGKNGFTYIDQSWLSLGDIFQTDLNLLPDSETSMEIRDPSDDLERSRYREWILMREKEAAQEMLRRVAKRIARAHHPGEDRRNESLSQEKKSPSLESVEGLGNSSGPFAKALKLVRGRTSKRAAQNLIKWVPSEENWDHSITAPIVPSLLDLSLNSLTENAERIVSLELIPDMLRRRLTDILCDNRRMGMHFLDLLLKGYPAELRIKNCSWLTEKQFQQAFRNCQTKNLRVLQLDLCGQCMLDIAFRDIISQQSNAFSSLAILSLRGASRLTDYGLKELVKAAPELRSINLGQCTLLTCDSIHFIAEVLGSNLRELYIDDCQKINVNLILPALRKFKLLEVLSVAEIHTVTDQFINEVVTSCGKSIKELDLANCVELTDCSLRTIGSSCVDLRSLNISNLHKLTDLGIEHLANGCRSIQKLRLCRNGFSDEAVASFLECCGESLTELSLNSVTKVGFNTAMSLAKCSRKLLSLDLSWCRMVTDDALGLIVDSCSLLKLLKVFGCKQITPVFLNGHSNPLVKIVGLDLSPILGNINLLDPEEVLLRYSSLPVCTEEADQADQHF